ncbi:hypothetical protein ACW9KT_18125 [Hymenobacter sp. HD11105]
MDKGLNRSVLSAAASNLTDITKDLVEATFDSVVSDGLIKDIPVINTIHSIFKVGSSIREKIFINMLLKFLLELKDIPLNEREVFINKLENSDYRNKAGEKIIVILDRLDDSDKASLVGKLFKACIQGKFSFEVFLRLSHIISNAFLSDIKALGNCFTPGQATYYLSTDLSNSLNRVGLTSSKLLPDLREQYVNKRTTGQETPLKHKFEFTLNNDALIIARELYDLAWIEKVYRIYQTK